MKNYSFYHWRGDESPRHEKLLLQDLAIASWFPLKKSGQVFANPSERSRRKLLPIATETTQRLIEEHCNTSLCQSCYWMEQCQVAAWAIGNLENHWYVHVMLNGDAIPLYYVIFHIEPNGIFMKGIWKSLLGSLLIPSLGGEAMTLLRWAYNQHFPCQIHVNYRLPFQRMLQKHGIVIRSVENHLRDGGPQGRSIYGQFTLGKKEGLVLWSPTMQQQKNPGDSFVDTLDHICTHVLNAKSAWPTLLAAAKNSKTSEIKKPAKQEEEDEEEGTNELVFRQFFRWMADNPEKRAGQFKRDYPLMWNQFKATEDYALLQTYVEFSRKRRRV